MAPSVDLAPTTACFREVGHDLVTQDLARRDAPCGPSSCRPSRAAPRSSLARPSAKDWTFGQFLHHLAELEVEERKAAQSSGSSRLRAARREDARHARPRAPAAEGPEVLPTLCEGAFVDRGDNVLAFGLPGRGKTHVVCAIGHELVRRGRRCCSLPPSRSSSSSSQPSSDLRLEKELAALDTFDAVILDDIGYVQQDRDEMEVLFTFLAERYERRSVVITSNLLFASGTGSSRTR